MVSGPSMGTTPPGPRNHPRGTRRGHGHWPRGGSPPSPHRPVNRLRLSSTALSDRGTMTRSDSCSRSGGSGMVYASIGRLDLRPAGIPLTMVPDKLPTAPTRGGPKGGAPSRRCPSRGARLTPAPPSWDSISVDVHPAPGEGRAPVVGVRPGSTGKESDSPATVPPPPTGTALPPPTGATSTKAGVVSGSAACGASVTRLVPNISNGGAPPSCGEDEEDSRAMEAGPAYRSDVLGHRTAIQPTRVPRLWYRKKC